MESSSGSAMDAPIPRSRVRRGKGFHDAALGPSSFEMVRYSRFRGRAKRIDNRRWRPAADGAHRGLIVIFQTAAQRVSQHLCRRGIRRISCAPIEQPSSGPGVPSTGVPSGSVPEASMPCRLPQRGSGRWRRTVRAKIPAGPSSRGMRRRRGRRGAFPIVRGGCGPSSPRCRRARNVWRRGRRRCSRMFSRIHLPRSTGDVRVG